MKILAIHGSPRKGGNSEILLDAFIEGAKEAETKIEKIPLYELKFSPCIECGECEHLGECVLKDDMTELYSKILEANLLVVSTPIFFYTHPSMLQAFFERFQALWACRYRLNLSHPNQISPKGILLALGATKGKKLFEATVRTFKFVMDALWGRYVGGLFFRGIEKKGEILEYPEILERAKNLGREIALKDEESWSLDRSSSP
ncbi:MAG: flavodoxin family protein [Caldimicrobium sp.]